MNDRWRIGVGVLALGLVVSCDSRTLSNDAGGPDGSGAAGVINGRDGGAAAGSVGGPGGQSGTFGPGTGGSPVGVGGFVGRGGVVGTAGAGARGGSGPGGRGGIGGRGGAGAAATGGTGGFSGFGGFGGTFVTGRGGGSAGISGRGGAGGTGGIGGAGGMAGIGGAAGRGGAGGTAGCSTCRTLLLDIEPRDVVYSAARNELYVSIPGDARAYPNTILVVDPATASVVSAIPIGSNPGVLALSDDGSTLWVGIDGAHAFRKVTMTSTPPVVGPLIHLPKANPSRYFDAVSMAVLAGAPLSVVVVLSDGGYTAEVRVFDDGVPRTTAVTNIPTRQFASLPVIAGPPGIAFGIDGSTFTFYVYAVSPSGITVTPSHNVLRSNATDSLAYVGGRVFTGRGDAIDVSNLAAPSWAGRLPYTGPVARRDPMTVMMLTIANLPFPSIQRTDVRLYSNVMLSELATVPVIPESVGSVYSRLVYAGGDAVAVIRGGGSVVGPPMGLVIVHDPKFGLPIDGGTGGTGGMGGTGGGGTGGTGGAPDPCPGCTTTTVQAYGRDMVVDPIRNLIYVASDATAPLHPSSIVTVDGASATVASFVPVGNDPQSLALSDDGSALWAGLAGERRVRRLTPGATPVPGPAYSLPTLLTSGEASVPRSVAVLPGAPSSIAVGVHGSMGYGRGVLILDDGQPRANFIQPPEVAANFLTNGPPGYLLGLADDNRLVVFRLGTVGATLETYGGLFSNNNYTPTDFLYSAGAAYAGTGEVVDLTTPDAPVPAGRFVVGGTTCRLASRSATRVMMLCPTYPGGPNLFMLDSTTFNRVGTLTVPGEAPGEEWVKLVYVGGDAVALLGNQTPLKILRAPMIGSPP